MYFPPSFVQFVSNCLVLALDTNTWFRNLEGYLRKQGQSKGFGYQSFGLVVNEAKDSTFERILPHNTAFLSSSLPRSSSLFLSLLSAFLRLRESKFNVRKIFIAKKLEFQKHPSLWRFRNVPLFGKSFSLRPKAKKSWKERKREREREMPSLGAIVALGRTSTRCKRSEVELQRR